MRRRTWTSILRKTPPYDGPSRSVDAKHDDPTAKQRRRVRRRTWTSIRRKDALAFELLVHRLGCLGNGILSRNLNIINPRTSVQGVVVGNADCADFAHPLGFGSDVEFHPFAAVSVVSIGIPIDTQRRF